MQSTQQIANHHALSTSGMLLIEPSFASSISKRVGIKQLTNALGSRPF